MVAETDDGIESRRLAGENKETHATSTLHRRAMHERRGAETHSFGEMPAGAFDAARVGMSIDGA